MNSESGTLVASLPVDRRLSWAERRIVEQLAKLRFGAIRVSFPGDRAVALGGSEPGPSVDMRIMRPVALLRRLFWRGDLGLAEAYMAGDWTTLSLAELMEFFARNLDAFADSDARHPLMRLATRVQHWANRNSRGGSRRNIAAHYDLGNDFYGQWLDETMTYSSARFDGPDMALPQAQENKYAHMLAMLEAKPGQRILEIGCGWGGFAEYAARQGMQVVGLTLSKAQLAYARQRVERAGLADSVDLRFCDYRDFDEPVDHVVSIEMFEAVGQSYWQGYFDRLAKLLPPGGRAALQVITIDESLFDTYADTPGGFIQTYIFPGGMLPTKSHLRDLAGRAGLDVADTPHAFGLDYAATLAHWHRLFNQSRAWMQANGFDRRFRRMWRYYLAFCEAGFRARQIDVVQLALTRAD